MDIRHVTAERKYVRPIEVVQQTGLSRSAVMGALWSGELRAFRKGRAWLIPIEEVDDWVRRDNYAVQAVGA